MVVIPNEVRNLLWVGNSRFLAPESGALGMTIC